jgi:hypothetical protein
MNSATRELVRRRAGYRCEYCRLHRAEYTFFESHIEHIMAKSHEGSDHPRNLCFSCSICNGYQGPNLSGLVRGRLTPLFNPRTQDWNDHFEWDHTTQIGRTAIGIATIKVLKLNLRKRVELRGSLFFEGRFPPPIE